MRHSTDVLHRVVDADRDAGPNYGVEIHLVARDNNICYAYIDLPFLHYFQGLSLTVIQVFT